MQYKTLPLGPIETNSFLIWDDGSKDALVVDVPPMGLDILIDELQKKALKLKAILLTHGHWDHMGDAQKLKLKTNCEIYAHIDDQDFYETPEVMASFAPPGLDLRPVAVDHWAEDMASYSAGVLNFEVRHIPGHAPGSILFYFKDAKVAFVGDAVFRESVGRFDLPKANGKVLFKSIKTKVYTLPDDTTLLPGHGPATSVAHEKKHNPYVQG